jgi:hypothetical protein
MRKNEIEITRNGSVISNHHDGVVCTYDSRHRILKVPMKTDRAGKEKCGHTGLRSSFQFNTFGKGIQLRITSASRALDSGLLALRANDPRRHHSQCLAFYGARSRWMQYFGLE